MCLLCHRDQSLPISVVNKCVYLFRKAPLLRRRSPDGLNIAALEAELQPVPVENDAEPSAFELANNSTEPAVVMRGLPQPCHLRAKHAFVLS